MMFRLLIGIVVVLAACGGKKECSYPPVTTVAPVAEQRRVEDYLAAKGIAATRHPNGFFYSISQTGTGNKPVACSVISLAYSLRLENDSIVEATPPGQFYTDRLGTLNHGLQLGVQLLGKGGSAQLFIPPSLGFGLATIGDPLNPVIPANSILIYNVELAELR